MQITDNDKDWYKPDPQLLAAINTALFLGRPLLLAGEPGTGKTEFAHYVARRLKQQYDEKFKLDTALRFDVKSISQSSDLFYSYDAIADFRDKSENPLKQTFISFNKLGIAIIAGKEPEERWNLFNNYESQVLAMEPPFGSVVLIDEIDKAPRDLPNDLLSELEKRPVKFSIKELKEDNVIEQDPNMPLVIIISSNNEKSLPEAFLRRCIFHYINFPTDKQLLKIVRSNFLKVPGAPDDDKLESAVKAFIDLRGRSVSKRPATSELIDWIACLHSNGLLTNTIDKWRNADLTYREQLVKTLGVLAKSKADLDKYTKEILG